ncbi:MAG TPA: amidohydrolase family protein [Gaiellaceae bacterium]|nr:amidohydrolase family protein [Gaiellaceae bacterium]
MTTFDLHQHLWPESFVSALSRRSEPPRLRGRVLELATEGELEVDVDAHRLETRLAALDRAETDVAVVSLPPTLGADGHPELVEAYHEGIAEVVRASSGRLRALATGSARDGFAGATVAGRALVEELDAVEPLLRDLEEGGGLLFVHPSAGRAVDGLPSWWPAVVDYTGEMQAAYSAWLARGAAAHPNLRVVFAILAGGAPVQLERLRSRGVDLRPVLHRNVFFDTASYGRRALELVLATYGVRQLVFGSDFPVLDAGVGLHALSEFGAAVSDAVRRENPSLLLA